MSCGRSYKITACVLPLQAPLPAIPWLLEVCPASTLKQVWSYRYSYKGREEQKREAREHILEGFEGKGMLVVPDQEIRSKLGYLRTRQGVNYVNGLVGKVGKPLRLVR